MLLLVLFLTACDANTKNYHDTSISDMTREKMLNAEILIGDESSEELPAANDNDKNETNSLDLQNNFDDKEEIGKMKIVDCIDISECKEKSFLISNKFKNIINNITYVEVMKENNQLLGYYIEYSFKKNKFHDKDECNEIGYILKETLSNHEIDFKCSDEGMLEVTKSK